MHTPQEVLEQQRIQRANAVEYSFLDFCCMFEANDFDEETETDERWLGLVRNEGGKLEVHAEFVYNGEVDDDGEKMGKGWFL